jgi:exodeoxyribonuclease VII large subunit
LRAGSSARAMALAKLAGRLAKQSPYVRLVKAAERAQSTGPRMRLIQQQRLSALRQTLRQLDQSLARVARNRFELRAARLASALGHWESKRAEFARLPGTLHRETSRAGGALTRATEEGIRRRNVIAAKLGRIFAAVNYRAVLARGFAMVLDRAGMALSRKEEAFVARDVTIRFADGEVAATVGALRSRKRSPRTSTEQDQKALF